MEEEVNLLFLQQICKNAVRELNLHMETMADVDRIDAAYVVARLRDLEYLRVQIHHLESGE